VKRDFRLRKFFAVFDAPKLQAPSSKPQRSSKSQTPKQSASNAVAIQRGALMFGVWNFFGAWSLELGASQSLLP
jgi:hypothetical protein